MKGRVKVGADSKVGYDGSKLDGGKIDNGEVHGGKVRNDEIGKKVQKSSKSKNLSKSKKTIGLDILISGARLAFTKLRQAFVKALIFYHFHLEYHIWIEIDSSGYTNSRIFN